jgi:hypothetical protein
LSSLQCWTSTELADTLLISKMIATSLWTFRVSLAKKTCYFCVFSMNVRDMLCVVQSEILFCDVQLYILFLLNWWIGTCQ